jgi:hypothetical protein
MFVLTTVYLLVRQLPGSVSEAAFVDDLGDDAQAPAELPALSDDDEGVALTQPDPLWGFAEPAVAGPELDDDEEDQEDQDPLEDEEEEEEDLDPELAASLQRARDAIARRQLAIDEAAQLASFETAFAAVATEKQLRVEREAAVMAECTRLEKLRCAEFKTAADAAPSLEKAVQQMQENMQTQMASQMQALTQLAAAVRHGAATATVSTRESSSVVTPPPLGLRQQPPVSTEKVAAVPRELFAHGEASHPETDAELAARKAALKPSELRINSESHKREFMKLARRFESNDESIGPGMRALFSGTLKD